MVWQKSYMLKAYKNVQEGLAGKRNPCISYRKALLQVLQDLMLNTFVNLRESPSGLSGMTSRKHCVSCRKALQEAGSHAFPVERPCGRSCRI